MSADDLVSRWINNPSIGQELLKESRIGIMIHIDASGSDQGSLSWFRNPDCKCAYHYIVLDNGEIVGIVKSDRRAWHAGTCEPSGKTRSYRDANSAFYGVAAAAKEGDTITEEQLISIAKVCIAIMRTEGWIYPENIITGHSAEAWERGRKNDPECDFDNPVLSVQMIIDTMKKLGFE